MIFIYITCRDEKEAEKIGKALISGKLAACVSCFPVKSIYKWDGEIMKGKEVVLLAKTTKQKFNKIEKTVKKMHSYEVPCIISLPVAKINKEYLNWAKENL